VILRKPEHFLIVQAFSAKKIKIFKNNELFLVSFRIRIQNNRKERKK